MTDPLATDLVALLPCPFCGSPGSIGGYTNDSHGFYATCSSVECYVSVGESYDRDAMPDHMFRTEEEAVAAWNRRIS